MNISQAKTQIKNAMKAYFTKDEFGNYKIPIEKQRPVLLIGPPGVGKTAIMEQVASELGVGLVSYSMTHHTRQSALGLPFISEGEFDGVKYRVSEYTMSEIIGAIYKLMRDTDVREGILFLDEINCVSETLAPCMLQFLQYKVFGQHRIPKGWIVVTAGNPPEYNKSVRDFDIVTWDRLKRIDVEPDYEVWRSFAVEKGMHPAVLTYLAARKKDFYSIESTVEGKRFVTARGWDDLSEMMKLYEENDLPVDEMLICQYIQNPKIAKDFAIYCDLFAKYRNDYKIDDVLAGRAGEDIIFRAKRAPMDERMSILGLLFSAVTSRMRDVCEAEDCFDTLAPILKELKGETRYANAIEEKVTEQETILKKGSLASSLTPAHQKAVRLAIKLLHELRAEFITGEAQSYEDVRTFFAKRLETLKSLAAAGSVALSNAFDFCEKAFGDGDGDEILVFVTELTVNYHTARFISRYGCDKYYLHNKELQFAQRQTELMKEVKSLDWDV